MKLRTGVAFMMSGVAGTLLYQQIKAEKKVVDELENMM